MNYKKYANKAYAKIRRYGSACKVFRSGTKTYNADTNEYEGDDIVLNGFALQGSFNQRDIDGTNIRAGDILLTCVLNGTPESNDVLEFCEKNYTVVTVSALCPDGNTNIYFKIQAR